MCDNDLKCLHEEDLQCDCLELSGMEQDGDSGNAGDDAVLCEGTCQGCMVSQNL